MVKSRAKSFKQKPLHRKTACHINWHYSLILSLIILLCVLWSLKLGCLAWVSLNQLKPQFAYSTELVTKSGPYSEAILSQIVAAETNPSLEKPIIQTGDIQATGFGYSGNAAPDDYIILQVTKKVLQNRISYLYLTRASASGQWAVRHNGERFTLKTGDYTAQAYAYHQASDQKSLLSAPLNFQVKIPPWQAWPKRVDKLLNGLVLAIIALIVIAAVFTPKRLCRVSYAKATR